MQSTHLLIHNSLDTTEFANLLKPVHATILVIQPVRKRRQFVSLASMTLVAIGTVAEHAVLVADISEPMDLFIGHKQSQRHAVHGCVPPALIEEPARLVDIFEVVGVCLRTPEIQVANLKIAPEMACAVAIGVFSVAGP